ncbi:MAG TPA: thiol reductant ABC exporter subunit CydD [Eggerthellaceae bacterium]|nr:thiol reductant ABC exporter subunit CydD [Eggerthellaceae bacterium]
MFDRNLMKLAGMKGVMMALVVLALLQAGAIAGQAWALSTAVAALWAGAGVHEQATTIAAFFACFAFHRLLVFAQETMLDRYSCERAVQLHGQVLERSFDVDARISETLGAASVATTASQGIDDVQTYLRIIPPKIIGMAAISLPLLACAFSADWPSGIILAVMLPVIMFFMILLGRQARDRAERQYAVYNRLSNHFLDTLRGLDAIVAAGAVHQAEDDVFRTSENLRRATVRTLVTATLSSAVLDLCATFGVAAVAMMLAFRLMDGSVDLATGLFALILAPEYFAPIRSFASDFHASLDGKNALAAVLDIVSADGGQASGIDDAAGKGAVHGDAAESRDAIVLNDVCYEYAGSDEPAVRNISLAIAPGERVALVGRSGSGKSTLAGLMSGLLQPVSGSVQARLPVHFVPQNPYIFRGTLADNMRFYYPEATLEEVQRVAQVVGLSELVSELPGGLDARIGEGERGLSGGQAHRVALARILLDPQPRILVFDEPTAHLDIETELEMKQHLLPLLQGRTVVFATHRMHWLADMDRVCVIEDGRLVESGRPADLAQQGRFLASLAEGGDVA